MRTFGLAAARASRLRALNAEPGARPPHRRALAALGLVTAIVAACGDDENPAHPGPEQPTLQNIWPNENGRSWTYRLTTRLWDPGPLPPSALHDSPSLVPPVTLDHAESLLASHPVPPSPSESTAVYRLVFDGEGTTQSGAHGQRLREEIFPGPEGTTRLVEASAGGFWNRLVRVRPDLRSKLDRILATHDLADGSGSSFLDPPLLMSARTAWVRTSEYIGSYGDLDTLVAFKYLTPSLSPRAEFQHQLIPTLADDVYLNCRVLRQFTASTEVGRFENALECLYVVDYGISETSDQPGGPIKYLRYFDYGTVIYAPTVGPIGCYERSLVVTGPPHPGVGDQRLELLGSGLPEQRAGNPAFEISLPQRIGPQAFEILPPAQASRRPLASSAR